MNENCLKIKTESIKKFVKTRSLKLNIYIITLLEWIDEIELLEDCIGNKIA